MYGNSASRVGDVSSTAQDWTIIFVDPCNDFTFLKSASRSFNGFSHQVLGVLQWHWKVGAKAVDLILNPVESFIDERFQSFFVRWFRIEEGEDGIGKRIIPSFEVIQRN